MIKQFFSRQANSEQQLDTVYGLSPKQFTSVNYGAFRQFMNQAKTQVVSARDGTTLIFNQQKSLCALIKPPYWDTRGISRPVRYFVIDRADRQIQPPIALNQRAQIHFALLKAQAKSLTGGITAHFKKLLGFMEIFMGKPPAPAMQRKVSPVWTTMRLTS